MTTWSGTGLLRVAGSPYEQGRAHGTALATEIAGNLAVVDKVLTTLRARGVAGDYERLLAENERFVAARRPQLLDEIAGIAEGAGQPYELVLALNLPVYQVHQFRSFRRQECTQVLVRGAATADGSTILAKTRDLSGPLAHQVVLRRDLADGRWTVEANVSGCVTWPAIGVSSDGFALASSGAWSQRLPIDWSRTSAGWLLANTHELLHDSRSVAEFREQLAQHPRMTPVILTAADRHEAVVAEVTPDQEVLVEVEDVAVRTNHYQSARLTHVTAPADEYPSSYHRLARATALIELHSGQLTTTTVASIMSDHDGYPQESICRHALEPGQARSLFSVIVDVTAGTVIALLGQPCRANAVLETPPGSGEIKLVAAPGEPDSWAELS